ncbi:hypothetical protein M9194_01595 [Vibrio sp. S4M6]|uniref:spore coat protein U domain-containing protein n=1 Tax=Vibrio sinus TaxID=2946865 RepID=UPI00202A776F|nr:spore coat protein U domain-containing protein [Vibrio sinus]MCL9780123.1 hypothetical protein [Vibrio sinus]
MSKKQMKLVAHILIICCAAVSFVPTAKANTDISLMLHTSCQLQTKPLDFGNVRRSSTVRQTTAFQITCGSAKLPNGIIRYRVTMYSVGARAKLGRGMPFKIFKKPDYRQPLLNGKRAITGQFRIKNHHGATPWISVYGQLKVRPNVTVSSRTSEVIVYYQLSYLA